MSSRASLNAGCLRFIHTRMLAVKKAKTTEKIWVNQSHGWWLSAVTAVRRFPEESIACYQGCQRERDIMVESVSVLAQPWSTTDDVCNGFDEMLT